jgi:long-chain acyl-CoA synthetase
METPKRTFDIIEIALKNHPLQNALSAKVNGKWEGISTQEFYDRVQIVSNGLIELGVQKGDKIATITNNRPEWNILDYAAAQIGAVICPVYPTISNDDYTFIFNDAAIKYAFVSSAELFEKMQVIKPNVASLLKIYTFDHVNGAEHWSEVLEMGKTLQHHAKVLEINKSILETDLVTIIYTSGTTGKPKGVMLSHLNLVSNALAGTKLLPVAKGDKALSFLPLCHVFERTLLNIYVLGGIEIYYAESLDTIGDNIKEVKPHMFTAVPRLIEKVYDKIIAGGAIKTGIVKKLFFWAVKKANNYYEGKEGGLMDKIADKLVFSKIRAGLGGNVKVIVSGSAALQPRLARFFWGVGLPILEGYGLTETSPVVAVNTTFPKGLKFGSVGKLLEKVKVKIAEDGEILVQGPNVMMGYYNQPQLTNEVIKDGWFHTGDIGVFDEGFLKITDRKKEMFKTSGGKYVAPQPIENKMKESPFIEQIMVVGEGKKHPSALIVPAFDALKSWLKETENIDGLSNQQIIENKKVIAAIDEEVSKYNKFFGQVEQLKRVVLMPKEWTVDNGELTPTLKLKRKIIHQKYESIINKIYGE